jgi:hypothetical protein
MKNGEEEEAYKCRPADAELIALAWGEVVEQQP